ncbi:MAG: hypothetical protein NC120_11985 [Ruminococcus sp.]|nr:hypothetical protein [Ruminococcus sp.]
MRISIDPPAQRSLTPNEQRVYKLLNEGMEPLEIAKRLHISLQCSCLSNYHDVPPKNVMGLIASIREKGWEIPEKKEENSMPKGKKTPAEKVAEIAELKGNGKTVKEISEETGISKTTVQRVCGRLGFPETKKEPAPSKDGTGTQENFTSIIIPEKSENVNSSEEISSGAPENKLTIPDAVIEACLRMRDELLGELEDIREQIDEINEFLMRSE